MQTLFAYEFLDSSRRENSIFYASVNQRTAVGVESYENLNLTYAVTVTPDQVSHIFHKVENRKRS